MPRLALLVAPFLLAFAGCRGDVVARAELSQHRTANLRVPWNGKPLAIWADVDMTWAGGKGVKPDLAYEIDLTQAGQLVGHVSCSTRDVSTSICGTDKHVGGTHDADCEYKLTCKVPPLSSQPLEVSISTTVGPNVKSTKKHTLNFRTD